MNRVRDNEQNCTEKLFEVVPNLMQLIRIQARQSGEENLTVPQYRVLHRLARQSATNSELADWIGVTLPAMSKMTDLLVKKKLVQRQRSRTDRRLVKILLTEEGRQVQTRAKSGAQEKFTQVLKNISQDQLSEITRGLEMLKNVFLKMEDINETRSIKKSLNRSKSERSGPSAELMRT